MINFTILDVGHGNCAVLQDEDGVVVIDCGTRHALRQFLKTHEIDTIDCVLISHADFDHIAGIYDIVADQSISIRRIYINPDATKDTDNWKDFRITLADALRRGRIQFRRELTTASSTDFHRKNVSIEILAPSQVTALGGVGGKDLDGSVITSNSMSAVVRVVSTTKPEVLLCGDMDGRTLDSMIEEGYDLTAEVLVFPHHGGMPGDEDPDTFASRLGSLVQPKMVVFSTGRGKYDNPRPDTIQAIRRSVPDAHIACTQLSKQCAEDVPGVHSSHLGQRYAKGRSKKTCCAGTIALILNVPTLAYVPLRNEHSAFIALHAPTALCTRRLIP